MIKVVVALFAIFAFFANHAVVAYDDQFDESNVVPESGMFSFQQQEPGDVSQQPTDLDEINLARQQEQPPSDLGGEFSFNSIGDDEQRRPGAFCRPCPRFLRRCRCRFPEDCRYIRRTCFTCPRWRCVRRRRGPFPPF